LTGSGSCSGRYSLREDEDLHAARDAGLASDEAAVIEFDEHAVDGGNYNAKEPLDVGF
jgi:hypothetical protein